MRIPNARENTKENLEEERTVNSMKTDPRFISIKHRNIENQLQVNEPIPKIVRTEEKVENWLEVNHKSKKDYKMKPINYKWRGKARSPAAARQRIPYFNNLKRIFTDKMMSRQSTQSDIHLSADTILKNRSCISNPEVLSANEELSLQKKSIMQEKLNRLHKPLPSCKRQTYDIHHIDCLNDSDECYLKRNCVSSNQGGSVDLINVCPFKTKLLIYRNTIIDPLLTDEDIGDRERVPNKVEKINRTLDKIGHGLDRINPIVSNYIKHIELKQNTHLDRLNEEQRKCKNPKYFHSTGLTPIYKLLLIAIAFLILSWIVFSIYYDTRIFHHIYIYIKTWLETHSIIAIRRKKPVSKWGMFIKFFNYYW